MLNAFETDCIAATLKCFHITITHTVINKIVDKTDIYIYIRTEKETATKYNNINNEYYW